MAPARDPYLVKSVVHSSRVLSAFRASGEALPLREIAARSGLPKSMAFRLLYTLERCGMIEKVGANLYRSSLRPFKQKLYRIGYAAQGTDYQFSKEVSAGLQRAAAAEGVELICVDNRYNPKIAQRNADVLVREHVDLVIEFQTDEQIAPMVAAKYRDANIPLIAIEIPHPGATYFGANNYEAGLIGGRYLGRWARQQWHAEVDEIVLIALKRAGSLPQMRLTGMLVGMKEVCPHLEHSRVTCLDGDGVLGDSFEATRKHLRSARSRRFVVRLAGRAGRVAPVRYPSHRVGRLLPGKIRRADPQGGARHPASASGAAGRLRQAPDGHAGQRQSHLSERRTDRDVGSRAGVGSGPTN